MAAVLGVRTDRPVEVKQRRRWIRDRAGVHSSWDECSAPTARAQRPRPVYLVLTPTNCETHEQHTTLPFPDNVNLRRCERGAALSAPQCVTALGLGCKTPRCPRSHVRPKALPSAWRPACGHRAGSWRWEQRKSTCQKLKTWYATRWLPYAFRGRRCRIATRPCATRARRPSGGHRRPISQHYMRC